MNIDESLFRKYQAGQCTREEKALIESWLDQLNRFPEPEDVQLLTMLNTLDQKMPFIQHRRRVFGWKWTAVAASIMALLTTTMYIYWNRSVSGIHYTTIEEVKAPVKSNAIIVLENNREFDLDRLKRNDTLNTGTYRIVRTKDDQIIYLTDAEDKSLAIYNTIRTKTGGTAQVQLADGTRVWLNTNSELRYPICFGANLREVSLQGEGYFEVAKQQQAGKRVPFFVRGNAQTIQVLGTKFNADFTSGNETALLEGAVAFSDRGSVLGQKSTENFPVQIRPNQVYDGKKIVEAKDITRYIDWKEGYFDLNELNVRQLAEKLSAWYGVEIRVDEQSASVQLFGRIRRDKSLKEVLDLIAQVHPMKYTMENNYIYIK
ncbi:MAG: FecR family protein [Sphingobacterium sp.]|jgi:ferric-dicitrate binding protein FerR (iron transport regulator)|nr:FecR family protein [Sphingobacterium sp.]